MASKMADGGAGGGSRRGGKGRKKNKKTVSLIQRLYKKLMIERGRNYFGSWFSAEEIKDFQDNPDILALDPLFQRYQDKMEAALEDFASEEGLESAEEIIMALEQARDETNEFAEFLMVQAATTVLVELLKESVWVRAVDGGLELELDLIPYPVVDRRPFFLGALGRSLHGGRATSSAPCLWNLDGDELMRHSKN